MPTEKETPKVKVTRLSFEDKEATISAQVETAVSLGLLDRRDTAKVDTYTALVRENLDKQYPTKGTRSALDLAPIFTEMAKACRKVLTQAEKEGTIVRTKPVEGGLEFGSFYIVDSGLTFKGCGLTRHAKKDAEGQQVVTKVATKSAKVEK